MERHDWNGPMVALGLLVVGLLMLSEVAAGRAIDRRHTSERTWEPYVAQMSTALERRDVRAATRAWYDARAMALAQGRAEGLLDVGDAYRRLAGVTGLPDGGASVARQLYLSALFRARYERSLAGVVRATEAFESLGDAAVVAHGLRVAHGVAAADPDGAAHARLQALAARAAGSPRAEAARF
jgi:hypothetical protein